MLECVVQKKIIAYLEGLPKCAVLKTMMLNKRGYPDLFICYYGRFLYIEIKADNGHKPSKLQYLRMEELDNAGAVGFVAYGYDNFLMKWTAFTKLIKKELLYA